MNPLFILSCARSGSTLLRLAIDTHPHIACPPELHLLTLAQRLLWTQHLTLEDGADGAEAFSVAIPATRRTLDDVMSAYLARVGKPVWCEKSVTSVNHLDILAGVYPEARVIVLYRHAADVVASGLQAIADRPEGYDFEPYLAVDAHRPQALLRYWLDKTDALLQFEQQWSGPRARVRYEDLVRNPSATLAALATALALDPVPNWAERIWQVPHQAGPGDASAYQRTAFGADRLGRGAALSWQGVSRTLVKRANQLLGALGYDNLEAATR